MRVSSGRHGGIGVKLTFRQRDMLKLWHRLDARAGVVQWRPAICSQAASAMALYRRGLMERHKRDRPGGYDSFRLTDKGRKVAAELEVK